MTRNAVPKTSFAVNRSDLEHNPASEVNSEATDKTIQTQNDELELHITQPGHEFNDKEILDKNADA
jgi:hypothetical protein